MSVDASTPWRSIGSTTLDAFNALLRTANSPLLGEAAAIFAAVKPDAKLYAAHLQHESGFGTQGIATEGTRNPTGLRPRGDGKMPFGTKWSGGNFLQFASWTEAAREWSNRVQDPTYAYASTTTIASYVHVYAPSSDGNNEAAYVSAICDLANALPAVGGEIMSETTLNMSKGLIPLPTGIEIRDIPNTQNTAWDDLGQRTVKGFVLHRMLGSLSGTDTFFRTMANSHPHFEATGKAIGGLTDYGSDAVTGAVFRWNDPLGRRSGWASGPFSSHGDAFGDGLAFARKFGVDAVNRDEVSWEISGNYDDSWSQVAMAVAAQACAHYAHDYGITYEQWPIAPEDGFSFVRWHQELCGPAEKPCPGPVVMNQTDAFIELVRGVLKRFQADSAVSPAAITTTPAPTPIFDPVRQPSWWRHGVDTRTDQHDGPTTWFFLGERIFTTTGRANVLTRPSQDNDAPKAGPTLGEGVKVRALFGGRPDGFDYVYLAANPSLGIPEGAVMKSNVLDPKVEFDHRPN